MAASLDVYQKWLGIPPHQQPPHSYRLLGIELFESDLDVIAHAADRQMSHVRTFQAGEHVAQAQQLLNEIASARVRLLNPQKKVEYDARLQAELAARQAPVAPPVPLATMPTVPNSAGPPSSALEELEADPVWKHPAVLAGGAVCLVLVVGIAVAMLLRSDDKVASPENPVPYSPGQAAEVPVGPGEVGTIKNFGEGIDLSQPYVPPAEDTNSKKPETAKPDSEDPTAGESADPEQKNAGTQQVNASQPMTDPTDPSQPPTKTKSDPAKQTPAKNPSDPSKTEKKTPASNPNDNGDDGDNNNSDNQTLSAEFTPDDPGPPEPDENEVYVKKPKVKLPIPEAEALQKTLAEVREIFATDYANAKNLEQKRAIARTLMQQARDVDDDMTSRYVLLTECRDQAEAGGDFEQTNRAIDLLDRDFIIDAIEQKAAVLLSFSRIAKNSAQRQLIAAAGVTLAERAVREKKFDQAEKLATQAQSLAQRVGDTALRQKARDVGNDIKKQRILWNAIQTALQKLTADPADGAAQRVYGQYLCLEEKDWPAGLEHLALSDQAQLKALAERDLAEPTSTSEQIALADAWHDFATSGEPWAQYRLREHHWYLTAFPEATGLTRTKVEKRLRENPLIPFDAKWMFLEPRKSGGKSD